MATALRLRQAFTNRYLSRHLDSEIHCPLRDFWDRTKSLSKVSEKTLAVHYFSSFSYHPKQAISWAGIWGKTNLDINQSSVMGPWPPVTYHKGLAKQGLASCKTIIRCHCSEHLGILPGCGSGGQGNYRSRVKPLDSLLFIFLEMIHYHYKTLNMH